MTIGGWILLIFLGVSTLGVGIAIATNVDTKGKAICAIVIALVLVAALTVGLFWYFGHTASGQRALTDQKSELAGGLDRVVTIYTANGDVIAQYSGKLTSKPTTAAMSSSITKEIDTFTITVL